MKKATKREVIKTFVHPDHFEPITQASKKGLFTVSFRETGVHSINCIGKGAPMKGHDILEKSIKEGSISKAPAYAGEGNAAMREALMARLKAANLFGLTGHWDNTQGLTGIYVTLTAEERAAELNKPHAERRMYRIVDIDTNNLDPVDLQQKLYRDGTLAAFTGDYDTHDMLTHRSGRPRTVLQGSVEERQIIQAINNEILQEDSKRTTSLTDQRKNQLINSIKAKGISKSSIDKDDALNDFLPIRHGAQVNFMDHMISHEISQNEDKQFIAAVAQPGAFPLAAVTRGNWYIIKDVEELEKFYTFIGAVLKETWRKDGIRTLAPTEGNANMVKYIRRPPTS
ncbi:hypothetical protein L4D00_06940 [Photobacterium swingsii]|uniref:hypothetical protein n=1 Tax=Photobacterium swingsii TaxID=680026 RepID=UPI003D106B64